MNHKLTLGCGAAILLAAVSAQAQTMGGRRTGGASGDVSLCRRLLIDETSWRMEGIGGIGCAGTLHSFDIDGDGDQDLLVSQDGDLGIWVNDGAGGFRNERASRIGGLTTGISSLDSADVDGDGDLDFVMGGDPPDGIPDRLWINRGGLQNGAEGNFVRDNAFPSGLASNGLTTAMVFGDADGDGDPDILVARGQSAHGIGSGDDNVLLINQGLFSGQFVSDPTFAAARWNANSDLFSTDGAKWADVDGDTDLDLFLINSDVSGSFNNFGHPNQLLLNDGGTFTDATASNILPNHEDNSFDAEFADIDADGDLDIIVANSVLSIPTASSGDVLINQGGFQAGSPGSFLDDPTSFLEPTTTANGIRLSVTVGDLDEDGDPDALLTVHDLPGGGEHNVWINQGGHQGGTAGTMERLECFRSYESISGASVFMDMDGDGDLDVVQTHCGSAGNAGAPFAITLYRNTSK